jgi:hypothetical protein
MLVPVQKTVIPKKKDIVPHNLKDYTNDPSPLLRGLNTVVEDRDWEVEVLSLVVGQRSIREKE